MRQIQAKRLWVVIDSCHAEGMATSKGELPADFIATALPKGVVDALKQGEGRASYYKQALAIGEKLGNKANQAACCSSLGLLALDRDRPTEARPWYERELALAQEVGRQSLVADAQGGLARVLEKEERYAEALPLALAALEIRERLREEGLDFSRQLVERLRCKAEME
ncbi:MAG: tetratricopeptide repeat protein [Nostoc sp.]|uniref:tetratricopeptide repeat protein n=1 Tax=Nostoc sp. TaxID=1180 RepID=UPI002FFAB8DC